MVKVLNLQLITSVMKQVNTHLPSLNSSYSVNSKLIYKSEFVHLSSHNTSLTLHDICLFLRSY